METGLQKSTSHSDQLDSEANDLSMGGYLIEEADNKVYKQRMEKRKEVQLKRVNKRSKEKGLIIVFTGNGKGKTTAALGIALRALGHGKNVAILQFIKGGWEPGEAKALKFFEENVHWFTLGEGFTWETQDRERDQELVAKAWSKSLIYLKNKEFNVVILDEINIAIKLGYLSENEVLNGINKRPLNTHVVLTGRGAPKSVLEKADLVTEMKLIKHPFKDQGVKAQQGIEF